MDIRFWGARRAWQPEQGFAPVSGTYVGQSGTYRLELRVDLDEGAQGPYRRLNLVSGDLFRDVGTGEWEHRYSFVLDHPSVTWRLPVAKEVAIEGAMCYSQGPDLASSAKSAAAQPLLKVSIPLSVVGELPPPATVLIVQWGSAENLFVCDKVSACLRTIELEIDRIAGTELPRPLQTRSLAQWPDDLPALELDIAQAYRRAGIDMRILSDGQLFAATECGADLVWDDDELHHAMEHHFPSGGMCPNGKSTSSSPPTTSSILPSRSPASCTTTNIVTLATGSRVKALRSFTRLWSRRGTTWRRSNLTGTICAPASTSWGTP
jgi:hypothetical protein